ncbi:S1 RNA-binding domain-containing protein [Deferribacteraceae bacterium V6Fe1]|nr:S1 RNA-binding domain-containing protein [Deferribacteraceae bacterium V6Fe1]
MQDNNGMNNEMKFEDFESMLEDSLNPPSKGSIVKGSVVAINGTDILVNIGYKSEGVIDKSELENNGELTVKVGDEIEALVEGVQGGGGYVRLSRKVLNQQRDFDEILEKFEKNKPVAVKIENFNDKGFTGKVGEVSVFIPSNHIDVRNKIKDSKSYIGKVLNCKILKVDRKSKSILASHKLYIVEAAEMEKNELFDSIKEGDKVKGKVKTIKEYGVFINIGAVDGFLHRDNIDWGKVKHPSKYLEVDDVVETVVLNVDKENKKIELGLKQLKEDPWNKVAEKYPVDSEAKGRVVTRRKKGYVVELEPGVDGFIPEEELSWIKNSSVKLERGDMVEGKVIGIDNDHKKVLMSLKLLSENPWITLKNNHPEGSVVTGKIKSVTDFGIFVDFGAHIDGLIKKIDISWTEDIQDLNEKFKAGDEITAKILKIDEDKERISLGIKQLEKNPWKDIEKLLPSGKVLDVEVIEVNKENVVVALPKGLTGIIPAKELDENKVIPEEFCKVGDTLKVVVLKIDKRNREILLSVKKYKLDSEKREVKEYLKQIEDNSDSTFNLGTLIKGKIDEIK